jgi:predicted secreted protein
MSTGIATLGTTLTRNATAIAQIQDIEGPDLSTDTDEITNHDSPDGVEEFLVTIKRTGEVTFPLVFNGADASHDPDTGLLKAWEDRSLDDYVMTFPDSSAWTFAAYVTGFSMAAPVDGHLSADVTLRPSGAPTYAGPGS